MEFRPIFLGLKRNKIMGLLMVLQVALTMTVLSSSILTAATTLKEWNLPSGVASDQVIRIAAEFYDDSQDVASAMQRDLQRLQNQGGVSGVARSNAVPFAAENIVNVYREASEEAEQFLAIVFEADHNLPQVLGLSLLAGRNLTQADQVVTTPEKGGSAASVMLSEDMADALFSGVSNAIGKTVWLSPSSDPVQVVGVYSNFLVGERMNNRGLSYQSIIRPQVIWSQNREPEYLVAVDAGNSESMIPTLADLFYQEQGRYVSVSEQLTRTQKRMYDGRISQALTDLVISCILVLITIAGITGLTSFQVNQRRKQIGTRRALGARQSDIMRYFLTENALLTLSGLVIGFVATFYLMFDLSQRDDQNYFNLGIIVAIATFMWLVSAMATWFPARKAALISPAIVTREG